MKRILTSCLIFIGIFVQAQQNKNVLFLGNSYTYANNLPLLIANIADSKGDSLYHENNTPGGHTLQGHASNTTSLNKIKNGSWDVVVMQDQSQRPSFSPTQVASQVLPYATALSDTINKHDTCTIPMFFMTWGRKNGDASNCAVYPPVCTYTGMQARLRDSYLIMGQQNNGEVAPVGAAWRETRANNGSIELYSSDGSHPNINGSYLAACTFYTSIFHESPVGAWKPSGIDSTTAYILQTHAYNTVTDSVATWGIDTIMPIPSMVIVQGTTTTSSVTFNFDASGSMHADSVFIDYGNGNTGSGFTTSEDYTANGKYIITSEFWRGCKSVIVVDSIVVYLFVSVEEFNTHFSFYPNPAQDHIKIKNKGLIIGEINYSIYSVEGRLIKEDHLHNDLIPTFYLTEGIYILELQIDERKFRTRFIKN